MTDVKSKSALRGGGLNYFLKVAATYSADIALLNVEDRRLFVENLCTALAVPTGALAPVSDQQHRAVVPFIAAALSGLNARQTVRALKSLNVGFPALDKSEVDLALHCATQHLCWKDFRTLAEAWGINQ